MNNFQAWYEALDKPSWTPSTSLIGLVWSILYPIILAVTIVVWSLFLDRKITFLVLLPFILNIISNIAFTPVQFGLRSLWGAAFVILIVWITTVWSMAAIWPYNQWCVYAFAPYLLWVTIATVLQWSITLRN